MPRAHGKEESLESLLFNHPYLLNPRFSADSRVQRQYVYSGGRVDIVFKYRGRGVLVECKRTLLKEADFIQLLRYVSDLKQELDLGKTHYLVGLVDASTPRVRRSNDGVSIRVVGVGRDIPRRLVLAAHGRYTKAPAHQQEDVFLLNF